MKLFDMLFGKKNAKTKKTTPSSPVRHPPVKKAPSAALDAFPKKQPAPARPERHREHFSQQLSMSQASSS